MQDEYADLLEALNIKLMYTSENIPTKDTENMFGQEFYGCDCNNECNNDCPCFTRTGTIYEDKIICKISEKPSYECNSNCKCLQDCRLKLVQFGPNKKLEIKLTEVKGYGLFTRTTLPNGSFVCEYAGEVITEKEAEKRHAAYEKTNLNMNYIFWIKEHFGENTINTIIDPTCIGNIGRFINHSCNANCELVIIRVNNVVPKLCIFSNKIINANEEITFNYGCFESGLIDNVNTKRNCYCREFSCKGFLPYHNV